MSDEFDGEDLHGKRDFEETTHGKRIMDEVLRAAPTDSEIFPKVTLTYQDDEVHEFPPEYISRGPQGRIIYEGIRNDWETNSPISPAPHMYTLSGDVDSDKLFGIMYEISRIRARIGRTISKIDSAKTAVQVFKSVRAETQVHPNDLFDEHWLDISLKSTEASGHNQILNGYPYARYRLNIDMPEGLDQHKRLISFTQGNLSVFADDNNYFAQNSNIFWYRDGLLLYGSTLDTSRGRTINDDVFVFSNETEIQETDFHKVNSALYNSLLNQGRHFEHDLTMQHLRTLYEDNDEFELGERLRQSIPITTVGIESAAERLSVNLLIKRTLDDFVKTQNKELITDSDFEEYFNNGLKQIREESQELMTRGKVPLHKLSE